MAINHLLNGTILQVCFGTTRNQLTPWMSRWKLGSMVRINGLFHLPINRVYWGYNLLILSFGSYLAESRKNIQKYRKEGDKKNTQESIHPQKNPKLMGSWETSKKKVPRNKSNILTINRQSFVEGDCKIPTKLANSRTAIFIYFHKIHLWSSGLKHTPGSKYQYKQVPKSAIFRQWPQARLNKNKSHTPRKLKNGT